MLNLYTRIKLPDGSEGLLLGAVYRGPGDPEQLDVLTDDYIKVICRYDQVKVIKRLGDTAPFSSNPGGDKFKVSPVERDNINRLREAIWHDHYSSFGVGRYDGGFYEDSWNRGEVKFLPREVDIRDSREAFAKQLSLL